MTEYEAATLATCYAALVIAAAIGFAQCFIVWRGLRLMEQDLERRRLWWDEWSRERERRHVETMRELKARPLRPLAAGTAPPTGARNPAVAAPGKSGAGGGRADETGLADGVGDTEGVVE